MKVRTITFSLLFILGILGYLKGEILPPLKSIWKTLGQVTWERKDNDELEAEVPRPNVSPETEALANNEEITFSESLPPLESIWKTLRQVTWEYKYNEEFEAKVPYPNFSPKIKALANKEITIKGYVVPTSMYSGGEEEFLILSAFPAASCFFCGGAGPESVVEVYPKSKKMLSSLGQSVTFKGRLELNPDSFDHLIYILRDAERVP